MLSGHRACVRVHESMRVHAHARCVSARTSARGVNVVGVSGETVVTCFFVLMVVTDGGLGANILFLLFVVMLQWWFGVGRRFRLFRELAGICVYDDSISN